ncbi:hypothetical protein IMG5_008700, partial [Ichthyophthirius multifiliis]
MANQVWQDLKERTEFWANSDIILEKSQNYQTKLLTLVIMEDTIKQKWLILPEQLKESIKNYMLNQIVLTSQKGNLTYQETSILHKCNSILIKIVKFELNGSWKNFIQDICVASKQDPNLCENSLNLLRMLSEEIFDYSKNEITSQQIQLLKQTMYDQFKHIFELCYYIASNAVRNANVCKPSLIKACLETFYVYLSWMPLYFIIDTDIVDIFLLFVEQQDFKDISIKCLTEIVLLKIEQGQSAQDTIKMKEKMLDLYFKFIRKVSEYILPFNISLAFERKKMKNNKQHQQVAVFDNICQFIALFLTGFFNTHLQWIDEQTYDLNNAIRENILESIHRGLQYLVNINEIEEDNIFKICVEFWHSFTTQIFKRKPIQNNTTTPLLLIGMQNQTNFTLEKNVYPLILTQVRTIIVSRMAKPQEVLIVIDENGNPCKEELQDTENNSLYELLKELLINLAKLDWQDMNRILSQKLDRQIDGSEWSFDNLNSLCWAIGSISGSIREDEERSFLISVIKGLLNLTELKKGKENKAVVASNIMYVVSQYPNFLRNNWSFLKTVVKKLFEFMAETFPGVMEMAVNTFLTVSQKCAEQFVKIQHEKSMKLNQIKQQEQEPYIVNLIRTIDDKIALLEPQFRLTFFEAVGNMINAEKDVQQIVVYLNNTLSTYMFQWNEIIMNAQTNTQILEQEEVIQNIVQFLKINERLCYTVGYNYIFVLGQINQGMNNIYQFYSQNINKQVIQIGKHVMNYHTVKKQRAIRKEILKLYICFFKSCKSDVTNFQPENITISIINPLQQLLSDYISCQQECKEAEVLSLYQIIFENLAQYIQPIIQEILNGIFMSTLSMITQDFNSFPDHRISFFRLLKAVVQNAIEALFNIPTDQFRTMIDCVVWAFKHHLPEISDIGLDVLVYIMKQINTNQMIANQFYQIYYINILKDVLEVLTDGYHKSGFKQQTQILQMLILIINNNF